MPTFSYIAKRADGAETRGRIDAASIDGAREELRKQGLMVEDIREQPAPPKPIASAQGKQQAPRPQQPKPQQQKPANQQPKQQPQKPQFSVPKPQVSEQPKPIIQASPAPKQSKPEPLPWSGANNGAAPRLPDDVTYAPLHETLRIFAGWLLAWYGLIYALGFLEQTGKLTPIPFISELFESRLVLQFTFGTFLLLAFSNIHRWIGRGPFTGFLLGLAYIGAVAGFVMYG